MSSASFFFRSSYTCRFFVLPCCFFDFVGRYQRQQSRKTQYREYLDFVLEVGLSCGFHVQEDCLRIPSTKRVCAEQVQGQEALLLFLESFRAHPQAGAFPPSGVCVGKSCSSEQAKVAVWGGRDLCFIAEVLLLVTNNQEAHTVSDPVLQLYGMHGAWQVLGRHPAGGDQTHQMLLHSKSRVHGRAGWP